MRKWVGNWICQSSRTSCVFHILWEVGAEVKARLRYPCFATTTKGKGYLWICWLDGVVERAVRVLELCFEIIEPNWSGRLSWWTGIKSRQSCDALAGWLNFLFCFLILPLKYSLVSLLCRDTSSQSHLMMCYYCVLNLSTSCRRILQLQQDYMRSCPCWSTENIKCPRFMSGCRGCFNIYYCSSGVKVWC
jgi:hypothetical protein